MARKAAAAMPVTLKPSIYCGDCKLWIDLPLRWARHNFENKHIKKQHPARWQMIQASRAQEQQKAEESTWTL